MWNNSFINVQDSPKTPPVRRLKSGHNVEVVL